LTVTETRFSCAAFATAFAIASFVAPAHATGPAPTRVFVAAQGSDSNPCTFALPCRTFQHAHDTVAAGGEIDVLDPAGYGALTISKAISIQGHGFAGISVASGANGITISALTSDDVTLNGLLIEGSGVGGAGIVLNSARALVIENCVVRSLAGDGLDFISTTADPQTLTVSNSYFTNSAGYGIMVETKSTGYIKVGVERTVFSGNLYAGINADGTGGTGALDVAVNESVAFNNHVNYGMRFISDQTHSNISAVLTRVALSGNCVGLAAFGPHVTVQLAQSTITHSNCLGFNIAAASILSYGDNYLAFNAANLGTLGSATKQ
jgi:hypothetical protein